MLNVSELIHVTADLFMTDLFFKMWISSMFIVDKELAEVERQLWKAIFSIAGGTLTDTALKTFFDGLDFEKLAKTNFQLEAPGVDCEYSYGLFIKNVGNI